MMGKVAVAGVSLILVVGVIVGFVATINYKNAATAAEGNGLNNLATGMKAVDVLCAPTEYKDTCVNTLKLIAQKNDSVSTMDLIKANFEVALENVKKAITDSENLGKTQTKAIPKNRYEGCKKLLTDAIDDLQASISAVGNPDAKKLDDNRYWLSGVLGYKEICLDGFNTLPEMKESMTKELINVTQVTVNALSVITGVLDILKSVNASAKQLNPTSGRLLSFDVDDKGYPTWFSNADRKLLGGRRAQPNVVVAQDGSGQYKTISEAIAAYPSNHRGRFVIYVKAGIYNEKVQIPKTTGNIFMYGDGGRKTIVTGKKSFADGVNSWETASFVVESPGFICKAMGFQNTAGPEGHQAVAIRVNSDMSAFFNCRFDGYQDTLLLQRGRQFYRNCVVSGTVDFIFGYAASVIQNTLIIVRRPMDNQKNTVTADGRQTANEPTGIVIQNCRIVPEAKLEPYRFTIPSFLGRPWKKYSRTVVMESRLGDLIQPEGWMLWQGNFALDTLYYAEYGNAGLGANTAKRVNWKGYHVIDRNEALQFTVNNFIQGNLWLKKSHIPYLPSLKN